jgi:hypothetical protein
MHLVAIHSLNKDKEAMGGSLAAILNVTLYEALTRLRCPGNGPLTIAVFAVKERAEKLSEELNAAGFKSVVLTDEEIAGEDRPWIVRSFGLGEGELHIETVDGKGLDISSRDVDLILCGIGISRDTTTETVKHRSINLGRAVLTGGMILTKTTKTTRDVTTETRARFINLYAPDAPVIVFRENVLDYNSLGSARKLSRLENFAHLVSELRRCCPGAPYDERLINKAAQACLLGPLLNPEKHLAAATALLAKVLRENGLTVADSSRT